MIQQSDAFFMAQAIKLAEKGRYTTDPNPRVGCVLVRNHQVIAEGWHQKAGLAHAEIDALAKVDCAKGATAYVTLEPCSHHGKTPPCCDALIAAGIKRVVVAMQDPNPLVAGRGVLRMKTAGIIVECGVLQQDAARLNQGFMTRMTTGLPFMRSKLAMSLDGRTAMASGESQWITSQESRLDVQRLRAESAVILTGINTVLADNPAMNVRLDEIVEQPIRVVLDSQLKMPLRAKMIALPGQTWVLTCSDNQQAIQKLQDVGCQVLQCEGQHGRLNLLSVKQCLAGEQINTVLVEAGAILNGALLQGNHIDEWVVYMATCILGDKGRGLFHLPHMQVMADKKQLQMTATRQVGADLRLTFIR